MARSGRGKGVALLLVLVGMAVGLAVFEGALRVAESAIPGRLDWPTRTTQAKADLLAAADGEFPQVVFIGSSVVDSALDPHLFETIDPCGRSAFNAGIDDASPRALEPWIEYGIIENGDPETIVIGLTSRAMRPGSNGGSYRQSRAAHTGALAEADRWFADRLTLVESRPVLHDPERWPGLAPPDDDGLDEAGWHGHGDPPPSYRPGPTGPSPLLRNYEPNPLELAALGRIVDGLRADGIEVVLADMAVSEDWADKHPGGVDDLESYRVALTDFAEEREVGLIDLTAAGDREFFIDPIHANGLGAARSTATLAEAMAAGCG